MQIIEVKNRFSSKWLVYITSDKNGPYYRVWQDSDTESIEYHDPKANICEVLLQCFGSYPYGVRTISEVIIKDMAKRGFPPAVILEPPWSE